jgi:hypothetical protein
LVKRSISPRTADPDGSQAARTLALSKSNPARP